MALLGSVMNNCKELRVTGQAILLNKTLQDKREPQAASARTSIPSIITARRVVTMTLVG